MHMCTHLLTSCNCYMGPALQSHVFPANDLHRYMDVPGRLVLVSSIHAHVVYLLTSHECVSGVVCCNSCMGTALQSQVFHANDLYNYMDFAGSLVLVSVIHAHMH